MNPEVSLSVTNVASEEEAEVKAECNRQMADILREALARAEEGKLDAMALITVEGGSSEGRVKMQGHGPELRALLRTLECMWDNLNGIE